MPIPPIVCSPRPTERRQRRHDIQTAIGIRTAICRAAVPTRQLTQKFRADFKTGLGSGCERCILPSVNAYVVFQTRGKGNRVKRKRKVD